MKILSVLQAMGLWVADELDYVYEQVLDSTGSLMIQRASEEASLWLVEHVQKDTLDKHPSVVRLSQLFDRHRVNLYLQKEIHEEIRTSLVQISVVSWFYGSKQLDSDTYIGFLSSRNHWFTQIRSYALDLDVRLLSYPKLGSMGLLLRTRTLILLSMWVFKELGKLLKNIRIILKSKAPSNVLTDTQARGSNISVAAPYWGRGATLDQSKSSDLFWVPSANLLPDQLVVLATRGDDPLDKQKYDYLRKYSIRAIAVKGVAQGDPSVPKWPSFGHLKQLIPEVRYHWKLVVRMISGYIFSFGARQWIYRNLLKFVLSYIYYRWIFGCYNIRLLVDHVDHPKSRLAADQAVGDLGGLSVGYQRTFEVLSTIIRASTVDVHFAFSLAWESGERKSKSNITDFISNGYVNDYAIPHVRERAYELRKKLISRGVLFLICLLDENSVGDKRAGPSHEMRAENYRFLLEKLLSDESLGLIIKPKKPADLTERLGNVAVLLDAALETGRCHLYKDGLVSTDILPSEASSAADLTIGLLYGSTAAFESSLTGTPTILIDREFVTYHPLYGLGEGQVVFRDWDTLWSAVESYRINPHLLSGFGDWSRLSHELDPFQDGNAGQRMGEYIGCLATALGEGMDRDQALDTARQQYIDKWGCNKIANMTTD